VNEDRQISTNKVFFENVHFLKHFQYKFEKELIIPQKISAKDAIWLFKNADFSKSIKFFTKMLIEKRRRQICLQILNLTL
jgi:hypothetical protein